MGHAARTITGDIECEMRRQDSLWGADRHLPNGTSAHVYGALMEHAKLVTEAATANNQLMWADVFREEVFEVLAEEDPVKLQIELVQVAAVIGNWLKDLRTHA